MFSALSFRRYPKSKTRWRFLSSSSLEVLRPFLVTSLMRRDDGTDEKAARERAFFLAGSGPLSVLSLYSSEIAAALSEFILYIDDGSFFLN